jgi:hypothetical protein
LNTLRGRVSSDPPTPAKRGPKLSLGARALARNCQKLRRFGFKRAGAWRLDSSAKGGARFTLDTLQNELVVYAFVVDELVEYIGICDSTATTLTARMSRYQNLVGAGTNKRIVERIRWRLVRGGDVKIYAMKPKPGPKYLSLDIDHVRGVEFPLIRRFTPSWNKHR